MKRKNKYYNIEAEIITEEEYANLGPEELGEGTREKEEASYDIPYVPEGFKYKEGTVETGYVIKDLVGNEFVWIPVDGINVKYEKDFTYLGRQTRVSDDTLPEGITSEEEQINNYQGFYIARYESGVPENQTAIDGTSTKSNVEGIPVSKQGAIVWTFISAKNVKINAESMINNDYVKSGLVTGKMWDAVMDYLCDNGNGVNVASDSSAWGNYIDSSEDAEITEHGNKQVAGFSKNWSYKGIYDIAGNCYEYTNELCDTHRILRSGDYSSNGSSIPASYRNANHSGAIPNIGFRVALYIL